MGITQLSLERLDRFRCTSGPFKMGELGAQNCYFQPYWLQIAKDYFVRRGIDHRSFDIVPHQGADFLDLREPLPDYFKGAFNVVTDFGTTEHVDGNYYMANKNIHDMTAAGGLIIRENPKTGHWPGHGSNYLDMKFYQDLAKLCGYEILELKEEFAMGNTTDGGNVCVVLRKVDDRPFIDEKKFGSVKYYSK